MPHAARHPAFPVFMIGLYLTLAATALYGLAAWIVPHLFQGPLTALAVAVTAAVVWAASLIGLAPVALLEKRGAQRFVVGYFVGAASRVVICLVAAVACVKAFELPIRPVMITLVAIYLPMLFLESGLVSWYLWRKDALGTASHTLTDRLAEAAT